MAITTMSVRVSIEPVGEDEVPRVYETTQKNVFSGHNRPAEELPYKEELDIEIHDDSDDEIEVNPAEWRIFEQYYRTFFGGLDGCSRENLVDSCKDYLKAITRVKPGV